MSPRGAKLTLVLCISISWRLDAKQTQRDTHAKPVDSGYADSVRRNPILREALQDAQDVGKNVKKFVQAMSSSENFVRPFMAPLVRLSLDKYPSARCLDGTPAGFYILPGDPKKFTIHLHGGVGCTNLMSCRIKTFSPTGSSKNWPEFHSFRTSGSLQNTDEFANKGFHQATNVLVPYCTGDLWSGGTTRPSSKTFNYWFSGHHVVDAVFDELMSKRGMNNADVVILTGGGADGGIGTVLHLDQLQERMKKAGSQATVVGAPIGGFTGLVNLQIHPYRGPSASSFLESGATVLPTYTDLWNSVGPQACVQQYQSTGDTWKCVLPAFVLPTMKSPIMFFQSQTDSVHLPRYYGLPDSIQHPKHPTREWLTNYVNLEKEEYKLLLSRTSNAVGFFAPACWTHTAFDGIQLAGFTFQDALADFIRAPKKMLLQDECGLFCNPTCSDPATVARYNGPEVP